MHSGRCYCSSYLNTQQSKHQNGQSIYWSPKSWQHGQFQHAESIHSKPLCSFKRVSGSRLLQSQVCLAMVCLTLACLRTLHTYTRTSTHNMHACTHTYICTHSHTTRTTKFTSQQEERDWLTGKAGRQKQQTGISCQRLTPSKQLHAGCTNVYMLIWLTSSLADCYGFRLCLQFTAHPKLDASTGKLHFLGYDITKPEVKLGTLDSNGDLEYTLKVRWNTWLQCPCTFIGFVGARSMTMLRHWVHAQAWIVAHTALCAGVSYTDNQTVLETKDASGCDA